MSSTSLPLMPELPMLTNDDSMLTRIFGKEVINYYAGGSLNRYSFLRPDTAFLRRAVTSPLSRYVALNNLNPLVTDRSSLAFLTFEEVKPLLGDELFDKSEDDSITQFDSTKTNPLIVFLGVLEGEKADEISSTSHGDVKGEAYFAIDVTPKGTIKEAAEAFAKSQEDKGRTFQANPRGMSLHAEAAAMYAQARSMIDWNLRHTFCAGCGNPSFSVHAGYKRVCPPTDLKGTTTPESRGECHSRHGVSNLCFPRTDPVMISAVVSADGQRVLLGRSSRFPPAFYSTLAGFLEPGESIEESVRREVWEEAGIKVGRVVIHSSQPWPYPSSLMIGAIAQALPGQDENINLKDKELEDARWYTMDEIHTALRYGTGSLGGPPPEGYKEGGLRLPPPTAIANRLISAVADGFLSGLPKI